MVGVLAVVVWVLVCMGFGVLIGGTVEWVVVCRRLWCWLEEMLLHRSWCFQERCHKTVLRVGVGVRVRVRVSTHPRSPCHPPRSPTPHSPLPSPLSPLPLLHQVEVSGLEHQVKKRHQYLENFSQLFGGGGFSKCTRRGYNSFRYVLSSTLTCSIA